MAPGTEAGEYAQVAEVQRAVAVRLNLDYPGRIASHSMVVVFVQMAPAEAGVVVVLRFPMLRSKYTESAGPSCGCQVALPACKAYHNLQSIS